MIPAPPTEDGLKDAILTTDPNIILNWEAADDPVDGRCWRLPVQRASPCTQQTRLAEIPSRRHTARTAGAGFSASGPLNVHINIILTNSLFFRHLAAYAGQILTPSVLASKLGAPDSYMTPISRLTPATVPTGRLVFHLPIPSAARRLGVRTKKSFICNKIRLLAGPNEPKEPKPPKPGAEPVNRLKTIHQLASFRHSPWWGGPPGPRGSPWTRSSLSTAAFCLRTSLAPMGYSGLKQMKVFRPLLLVLSAMPCLAATFGTVVPHAQPLADLVIDEARKRLYVVNTYSSTVEVFATNVSPPRLTNTIKTDATPLSIALSRETPTPRYLYVACYDGSTLDIIDLNSANFTYVAKQLDAKPQGVAVGFNGKVLVSTVGTGTGAEVLVTYDPVLGTTQALSVAPPAPVAPALPPPNGIMYLAGKSRLQASLDGKLIIGVNFQAATRTVFVFDVASSIVLSSRVVPVISPTLAVSPDGSKFLSGPMLFDTQTLAVLAQQNTTNSPYVFPASANFNVQTSQGGAVFLPDGSALLAAYNIVPTAVPAAATNSAQMTVNTPDTMLIQLGIKLQENLSGKMVITSDGATAYAISQSGFIVLPIGTLKNQPIGMPDSNVALLASDQCGVTAALNSATIPVRDIGGGRITVTAQALTSVTTTPTVRATSKTYGGDVTAQFSAVAARTLGTAAPDQLLIQANEAVNIIPTVRVFQNTRNAEARGTILPIDWGASSAGLADMLGDTARQRIYIANPGLNRLEVFDMQKQQFLTPIPVSQLPRSMAFGSDGNTLYVASGGGEQISIVDLTQGQVTGPRPLSAPPVQCHLRTDHACSSRQQPARSPGHHERWHPVEDRGQSGDAPSSEHQRLRHRPVDSRAANHGVHARRQLRADSRRQRHRVSLQFGCGRFRRRRAASCPRPFPATTARSPPGPTASTSWSMTRCSTWRSPRIPSPAPELPAGGALPSPGGPSATGRPVAAVAAVSAPSYARFSTPVTAANATPSDTGLVEVVDVNTLRTTATASALETPSAVVRAGARVNVIGRSMVLDSAGTTAFVLTASGLSVIPLATSTTPNVPQVPASGVVNTADFLECRGSRRPGFHLRHQPRIGWPRRPVRPCQPASAAPASRSTTRPSPCWPLLPPRSTPNCLPPSPRDGIRWWSAPSPGRPHRLPLTVTISKYAPAVFMDAQGAALYHANGTRVNKDHPGTRDEELTLYATGLGVTTGGKVTVGTPSPASPLAVTAPVSLYFGNPLIKEAAIIVDWSGLLPGSIGVYQINCRIPGAHINGDGMPITLKIGGVSSPTTAITSPWSGSSRQSARGLVRLPVLV